VEQKLLKKLLKAEGVWNEYVFLVWYSKYSVLLLLEPAMRRLLFKNLLTVRFLCILPQYVLMDSAPDYWFICLG